MLRRLEQARRSALENHVHRTAQVGPRVLISESWYNGGSPRQSVRAAAWTKPEPESLPRKRSPIWSCVRAPDRLPLLAKAPGRLGGEADDDFGRDTFATADVAGEAVFGAEA